MRIILTAMTIIIFATAAGAQPADQSDKLCIFAAARQLPVIQGTEIAASRTTAETKGAPRPQGADSRLVEIDVRAAGQSATYLFKCIIKDTTIHAVLQGMPR